MNFYSRKNNIDCVRGMAAICVMLQHSLESSGLEKLGPGYFALNWINFGEVGVVSFFLVSGFVIPLSLERSNSLNRFWVSRIFRLYPIYIISFIISSILFSVPPDAKKILAHLIFAQNYLNIVNLVPGSWTLFIELVWYFGFSLLFIFTLNRSVGTITVLTLIMLCFSLVLTMMGHRMPPGQIGLLATCVIGLFTYRLHHNELLDRKIYVMMGVIIIMLVLNFFAGFYYHPSRIFNAPSLRCVLISWTLAYFIYFISFKEFYGNSYAIRFFKYLGFISYSIYMLHPYFTYMAKFFDLNGIYEVIFIFVATFIFSSVSYRLIERPAIRFGHRIYAQRNARRANQVL